MGRWTEQLKEKQRLGQKDNSEIRESGSSLHYRLLLRLSELAKRNIALKIFSQILGCEIWLCGNEKMAFQVKQDDPEAITYTVDEMRKIMKLNPTPEDIKRIHNLKSIFNGSRILESTSIAEFLREEG